jgi:glycosyltransferase involved in cell wall biosynthesis
MMNKINVMHVADKLSLGGSTKHGVAQLFTWWFPEYNTERYNVSLCSFRTRDKAGEDMENLGIQTFYLGRGKFDLRALLDLVKVVRRENIQVLHLHGYGACTFGRICGRITRIPAIVHEHMEDANIPFYQRLADRVLSKSTTYAIAVSNSVKRFMIEDRSVPEERMEILYNGAPLHFFYTNGQQTSGSWKEKLNIPENHLVVGIVGRLHLIKGHTYFLQAAQKVLQEYKNVTFLVVGDGELMKELKEESGRLGIDEKVIFMGYCDNVASVLKEVDIKVISSLSEGIPLTLFEAMAAGCPVVSTDVGGIKEILDDGVTGFLTPSKEPQAQAEKILLLLKDDALRERMSKAAKAASRQYNVTSNVRQFEKIYDKVLNRGG